MPMILMDPGGITRSDKDGVMVQRHFDDELAELRQKLAVMGSLAESMIRQGALMLMSPDDETAEQLVKDEDEVNRLHMAIDESCMRLLVLRQPVAVDLRLLASALRMSSELERIGDQSINLMKRARKLRGESPVALPIDLQPLIDVVVRMVNDSLDAFSRKDVSLAKRVLELEQNADDLRHLYEDELAVAGEERGKDVLFYIQLTLIVYHLERIGDHATNIAEDVIFLVEGEDIRHQHL
ncbi:MAG: phosphate signaling complex protein PhoU [candidate division Zixibacteria bacterium]|nr:phosphate signaling complex protein PhoU [candidate division Zixibacteria bacterium]